MSNERPAIGIDTSGRFCSAALVCGGQSIAQRSESAHKGQAERLFPMLHEILSDANTEWRDLKALAAVTGPGNYTGIRLAVSAVRGLSLSLGIPSLGLSAFAAAAFGTGRPCHVLIEAPQGRAHAQTLPGGTPEFGAIDKLSPPAEGTAVVGCEFARAIAASWNCEWRPPRWSTAEAAARFADAADLRCAEAPVPFYNCPPDARSFQTRNQTSRSAIGRA